MPDESIRLGHASGECEIDLARRELRVLGSPVPVGGRAFEIIEVLARSAGELVTKNELIDRVWPGAIISENTLHVHAGAIRKALGPNRGLLKTESGRGYRLLGDWTIRRQETAKPPVGLQRMRVDGEPPVTNLPATVTRLIGRKAAAAQLRDLVSAWRVVTLAGPGGIGKTSLAVKVARDIVGEFANGGWLLELASLSDPALVPSAVASVLGLTLIGDTISSIAVAGAIGRRHLLLIVDNCEHVIEAVAEFVEAIVRSCPNVTLLMTSREIIRATAEHVYRVPPLEVPAPEAVRDIIDHSAVELFVARANALGYLLNADALPLIADICRRLDGIPLAIEFAAARAAALGVEHVATGLNSRFALLTSGRRTALPRHRTLRATLDWSYDLLTEEEQALLCRLAIFPAGFTVAGAVAVGAADEYDQSAITNGIASLVEKSLITIDASESGPRWRILETIRSYALDKLAECGDLDQTARRHSAYFRNVFASAVADYRSRLPAGENVRYGREIDNVRAALDWSFSPGGDVAIGIDLTAACVPILIEMSLVAECRERCERALHRFGAGANANSRLQMLLQLGLGFSLTFAAGPSAQVGDLAIQARETAEILGDLDAQARALFLLALVCRHRGESATAMTIIERLQQICQQIGDPLMAAGVDRFTGATLIDNGRLAEGQRWLERVIRSDVSVQGHRLSIWWPAPAERALARAMLTRTLWLQGCAEKAKAEAEASVGEIQGVNHLLAVQVLYTGICIIAPMMGDFAAAERAITHLSEAATSLNSQHWKNVARLLEGKLMVERGEFAEGVVTLRSAFARCGEAGWNPSAEYRGSLALALARLGRLDEANDVMSEAMASASGRENRQHWYGPELRRIKADILLLQSVDQAGLAEDGFEQAAILARAQGALSWELRIALSLTRVRMTQGRGEEARQILAAVYHRFTEGFDTTDLREAKLLLDALSPSVQSLSSARRECHI